MPLLQSSDSPFQVALPYSFSRVSLPGLESIIAGYLLNNTDSYFTNNSGLTSLWAHRTSLSTRMITLYSSITNQILLFAFVPHAFICSPKVDQYHGQYLPPLYRRIDAVATNTGQWRTRRWSKKSVVTATWALTSGGCGISMASPRRNSVPNYSEEAATSGELPMPNMSQGS